MYLYLKEFLSFSSINVIVQKSRHLENISTISGFIVLSSFVATKKNRKIGTVAKFLSYGNVSPKIQHCRTRPVFNMKLPTKSRQHSFCHIFVLGWDYISILVPWPYQVLSELTGTFHAPKSIFVCPKSRSGMWILFVFTDVFEMWPLLEWSRKVVTTCQNLGAACQKLVASQGRAINCIRLRTMSIDCQGKCGLLKYFCLSRGQLKTIFYFAEQNTIVFR